MYGAEVPYTISFYYLFSPPAGMSETGLFVWLTGFAVLTRTFLTFYSVPHNTLGAELSQDYDERTLLSSLCEVVVQGLASLGHLGKRSSRSR